MSRWPGLIPRLESKVRVDENGCWIWTGTVHKVTGYGYVYALGKTWRVHRLVYTLLRGAIPEGRDLDHVRARGCHSRACCNPDHLEPVTRSENNRRGDVGGHAQRAKTECIRGHPFTPENTYIAPAGKRACRRCRAAAQRRYVRRR